MLRFFFASLLLTGLLASCAPTTTTQGVTAAPLLIKASETAARGQLFSIQGRFLGGRSTGRILVGADELGKGGVVVPDAAVQSWTDTEIVFRVPENMVAGGAWLFVEVGGKLSTGLRISFKE